MEEKQYELEDELPSYFRAFKQYTLMGLPIMLQMFLVYFQAMINYYFITQYDDPVLLGGLGLGMFFYACFYVTLMVGMMMAINTFGSQLRGMKRLRELGFYLNGARMIAVVLTIPIMLFLYFSESILILIGQDEALSYQASRFLIGLCPSVLLFGLASLHEQFLMSQKHVAPGLFSNIMACVLQFILDYLLIFKWNMGMLGAGIGVSLANTCQSVFLFSMLYYYQDVREALQWPRFDKEQWRYIKSYLTIGFPSMLMCFLEMAGVEIFQPLSGLIGPLSNGAQAIVMNMYACMCTIYMGASIASSIFVGQCIGENNMPKAKRYASVTQLFIIGFTTVCACLILLYHTNIIGFFSSNTEIRDLATPALIVLAFALIPDSLIYSQVGILRGLGKQKLAATLQIASIFLICLPLGCVLAFVCDLNITGFWLGFFVRCCVTSITFYIIIWKYLDWELIAIQSKNREDVLRTAINQEDSQLYGSIQMEDNEDIKKI